MVHWAGGHQDLPSKIWGYIILTKLHHPRRMKLPSHLWGGTRVSTNGTYAIIESTSWTGPAEVDALFREVKLDCHWTGGDKDGFRRKFYLVDVEAFKEPLVVIPNQGTKDRYFVMTPRSTWADQFATWLDRPFEQIPAQEEHGA